MTKSQIKAELRRCALEDVGPFCCQPNAFNEMHDFWLRWTEHVGDLDDNEWRMFYLFIAEAL